MVELTVGALLPLSAAAPSSGKSVVKGIAVEDHALVHGDGFLQSSLGIATPLRISDDSGYQSRVVTRFDLGPDLDRMALGGDGPGEDRPIARPVGTDMAPDLIPETIRATEPLRVS